MSQVIGNGEQREEISFCPYCGTKLDKGASFCKECGKSITRPDKSFQSEEHKDAREEEYSERKTVYEGTIHKCPNCGEPMNSFVTKCPACGHEIRDVKSVSSVKELSLKLERIESKTMPEIKVQKSVMKKVFGKDFNDSDEVEDAKEVFEEQKRQEKANVIINYAVPNTKEDILEFMILASSNISTKIGTNDEVTKAWISKLEQVYKKAEITMGNNPEFSQIKAIYEQKHQQISNKKILRILGIGGGIGGWFLLMGIMASSAAFVCFGIGIILVALLIVVLMKKR